MADFRTVISGGTIVDGRSPSPYTANIVIEGERIAAIDNRNKFIDADITFNASGLMVCPGFIDAHVHAEETMWTSGCLRPALAQGVTTLILGQDGCSWAPSDGPTLAYMQDYFASINGRVASIPVSGISVRELLDQLDHKAQNIAYLVPQGNLRLMVAPRSTKALDPDELAAARQHLEVALSDGAIGMSSGLDYVPSLFLTSMKWPNSVLPCAEPKGSMYRMYGTRAKTSYKRSMNLFQSGLRLELEFMRPTLRARIGTLPQQ